VICIDYTAKDTFLRSMAERCVKWHVGSVPWSDIC